ncbi:MAG: hypothetical protein HY298_12505 [Verrucomicrobia bacterium]|nr:hypothetical protein [Verrucomicrobiota bacterium]
MKLRHAFTFLLLATIVSSASASTCVQPPPGLVSWWRAESNALDHVSTNHGNLVNGVTFAPGKVGQAFNFSGTSFVDVPNDASLSFSRTSAMTVALWAYRTGGSGGHLLGKRVSCGSDINYQLFAPPIGFGGEPGTGFGTSEDLPLNQWTHLAVTFDGTNFSLYINGSLSATNQSTLGAPNNASLRIGTSGDCVAYTGLLDEIQIFNRALSAGEVAGIVTADNAGLCVGQQFNPTSDFSDTNGNPNGVWSYGWMPTDFSQFNLFTNHLGLPGNNPIWYGWGGDRTPGIWHNLGGPVVGVPTGWLAQHPGNGTEPCVLRWTAPVSGDAHVAGRFLPGDGGYMQVAVRRNNQPWWNAGDAGAFSLSASVVGGDTVDFAVYGGYFYGTTPIEAEITLLSSQTNGHRDLLVAGISAPASAVVGQPTPIVFTLTNAGDGIAFGGWADAFLLATNLAGAPTQTLAVVNFNGVLSGHASVTVTQTLIFPASDLGQQYLGINADSADQVSEVNEANNTLFSATPIQVTAPDLAALSVGAPASAQFGQTINVTWNVQNAGDAAANAVWSDKLYLTTNSSSLGGAILLFTRSMADVSPLVAGDSYVRTQAVTLPLTTSLLPGNYFIVAVADQTGVLIEANETNNTVASSAIVLSNPPLPDLRISSVVGPDFAFPGEVISVVCTVTNSGSGTVSGNFSNSIVLSADLTIGGDLLLGGFGVANALPPNASITATQTVSIPLTGISGALHLAVLADSDNLVFEQDEGNNAAFATNTITIPAALKLSLSADSLPESPTNAFVRASLSRNGVTDSNLVVNLSASISNELQFPPSVTIPAGQSVVLFDVHPRADGIPDGDKVVTLRANGGTNIFESSANLTVIDVDKPVLTLTLQTNLMMESASQLATVSRAPTTTNDLLVLLIPSSSSRLLVPQTVTIPANQASVQFTITAVDNPVLELPQTVSVTASAAGFTNSAQIFTIFDNDAPMLSLQLGSTTVSEGAGGAATIGTITRTFASAQPMVIALSSSNLNAAIVPASVTIPANVTSTTFPVGAVNNSIVDGTKTSLIAASAVDAINGQPLGPAAQALLQVTDDDGPTLSVSLAQTVVREGLNPATTATISRNTGTNADLLISLASSDTTEATVQSSATIPAGQSSVTVNIASVNDGVADGNQNVDITASAGGFTSGSARLVVSDTDLPDLIISQITLPTNGYNGSVAQLTYTLANSGVAAMNGTSIQQVLLSSDPYLGNDTLIGTFGFTGTLAAGGQTNRTIPFTLPSAPGTYWVIVTADSTGLITEGSENNNTSITAVPIQVTAAYTAVVATAVTTAPTGTDVPLTGSATSALGGPATNVPVNIYVDVRSTRRTLAVTTDASGQFSTVFHPLPGEAGHYDLSAANPGVTNTSPQDSFTLLGMRFEPPNPSVTMAALSTVSNQVAVVNLSDMPITGLSASAIGLPPSLSATIDVSNALPGSASIPLSYTIQSLTDGGLVGTFLIRVTGAGGVVADLPVNLNVRALQARLVVYPGQLSAGMLRGAQTLIAFDVVNEGGKTSGPVQVHLPDVPWMSVASPQPLPSLAPGETNRVTLQLAPAVDFPLGQQQGILLVSGDDTQTPVSFSFVAISSAKGILNVEAVDELTFYGAGAPKISGAAVTLRDAVTTQVITNGITDTNGQWTLPDLQEAYYIVEVSADKHTPFHQTMLVSGGLTNTLQAFLSRQTVQYFWTVVPTEIQDRTRIQIETVFETVVPIPVITVEPSLIDLADLQGDTMQVDLKISNHGLIAANGATLHFGSHPDYEIKPLTENLGTIAAQSTLTVPLLIRNLSASRPAGAANRPGSGSPCTFGGGVGWSLVCGKQTNQYSASVTAINAGDCSVSSGGSPVTYDSVPSQPLPPSYQEIKPAPPPPGGGGGAYSVGQVNIVAPVSCAPCGTNFEAEPVFSVDLSTFFQFLKPIIENAIKAQAGGLVDPTVKIKAAGGLQTCCSQGNQGYEGFASASATLEIGVGPLFEQEASLTITLDSQPPASASLHGGVKVGVQVTGSLSLSGTLTTGCLDSGPEVTVSASVGLSFFGGVTGDLSATIQGGNQSGETTPVSVNGSVQGGATLTFTYSHGTLTSQVCSEGLYYTALVNLLGQQYNLFAAEKNYIIQPYCPGAARSEFLDYPERKAMQELEKQILPVLKQHADKLKAQSHAGHPQRHARRETHPKSGKHSKSGAESPTAADANRPSVASADICARVRLHLDQDLVMTRSAFNATLELVNNDPALSLSNIAVQVNVLDVAGNIANDKFGLEPPRLTGLNAVDGTGVVPSEATGIASWILIPNSDAAPEGPTQYSVGGLLTYTQDGRQIMVPLLPVPITVFPDARLKIKYFHQRDVFSDDPFTPLIEPAEPYSLGVLIQNVGKGAAKNVTISSSQPTIVENEKGLLIDFKIIATQVGSNAAQPSLTANFGDIAPGKIGLAQWLFQSSLQGQFIDYSASFTHVDSLGDPKLSLVDSVEIHEMNHVVRATGAFDDGLPDFLVNDVANGGNLPDTLYLSDGSIMPVSMATGPASDGPPTVSNLLVHVTAAMPAGWAYLEMPDPANGLFKLVRVRRPDNSEVPLNDDAWITDRTFIENSHRPIDEFKFHLLDYNSTGSYTLEYAVIPGGPDTTPPTSAVTPLNEFNTTQFAVSWSGQDEEGGSGVASFDIFVSDDGGPFTPWLQNSHVTAGIYSGVAGHHYSFYSVAVDGAGNREAVPGAPDAQTTVTANTAPVISPISDVTINEGQTVDLTVSATDNEGNAVTFSVAPGAPPGMTINPVSGALHWETSEAHGPGVYPVSVHATDNGIPSLLATRSFNVTVNEVNSPPVLPALAAAYFVTENETLVIDARATDADIPANPLEYTLNTNAPAGAGISGGFFSWTPSETQGGTTNVITITVNDHGAPPYLDSRTFTVVVLDTNTPPVIEPIPDAVIFEGDSLSITAAVSDADIPADVVTLSMLSGTPTNAVLDNASRVLTWTPLLSQVPSTNLFSLLATDNGTPSLSSTSSFTVIVVELKYGLNLIQYSNGLVSATFKGVPGRDYAVIASSNLFNWQQLFPFTPTNRIMKMILETNAVQDLRFYAAPQLTPELFSLALGSNGEFRFALTADPGRQYQLQTSSNLLFWDSLPLFTATNWTLFLSDTNTAGFNRKFYRVLRP